ncbi:hypothetical protein BC938DRAFT_471808 [Jimgerdemannia flammicorona]|uniref:Protein kinase domain-containing protein n=1 Tax=Jimgerdemannia flammicorona TaxID=994334 RepID=A0A433Q7B9_9FUNG|nr:hypothetical protein BC938DRAFT_471808 [Jimgerdemannia flammicorona]
MTLKMISILCKYFTGGLEDWGVCALCLSPFANTSTCQILPVDILSPLHFTSFGFSMFLNNIAGEKTSDNYYEYNDFIPANAQKNLDYLAPEFVIDNEIAITNDMFALGCLIYSVHNRGATLLNTFHNIRTYERKVQALATLDFNNLPFHLQDVIRRLLTRDPSRRMTATEFQVSKVFDNILVSTMKYMESFPEKTREEKAAFMKGMVRVLGQFPDRVLIRKILPSLLEELKDHSLLPFTLPNIFYIIQKLTAQEFSDRVLSSLKPIFTIREPPQNLLVLLEKLDLLQQKTPREVFRDGMLVQEMFSVAILMNYVMPLIYAALETPVPAIQEKALKVIPTLTESLDYTTIKGSLFPRALFVQTTILSVKVSTLICFHSLLKVLDKFTMQEKLVPILKNIKTKEPAVMLATLAVYDEMGKHLDKEIIATEFLPQLWRMSFGPLLNVDQFKKFMKTIRELSARVEEQHTKHLQQVRSLEEQTRSLTTDAVMAPNNEVSSDGAISDFERLVQGNLAQSHSAADGGDDAFGAMVGSSTVVSGNTNIGMFGEDSLSNSGSASPQFAKQLQQQQQSRPSSPMSGTGFGHSPVFGTTKSASVYQQPATPTLLTSKYQHPTSVSPTLSSIPHMASNNLSSPSRSSSPLSSTWAKSTTLVAAPIIPLQPPIVSSSSSSSMITPVQPPIDNGFGSMTSAPMNTSIHQRSQVVSSIPVVAPNFDALKSYPGSFSHTPTTIFPNNNFGNEMMAGGMGVLQPTNGISSGSMGVMQPTAYNGDGRVNSSSNKAKKEDLDLFDPFAK